MLNYNSSRFDSALLRLESNQATYGIVVTPIRRRERNPPCNRRLKAQVQVGRSVLLEEQFPCNKVSIEDPV